MSEVITSVILDPIGEIKLPESRVIIAQAKPDLYDPYTVGFIPDLWNRLGQEYDAAIFFILGDNGSGYNTSSIFLKLLSDETIKIQFEGQARNELKILLEKMLDYSTEKRVLFFCEKTYFFERSHNSRYKDFELIPPCSLSQFLSWNDSGLLKEERIYCISAAEL